MTDRETRAWKRLAVSAAGAVALLTARVLYGRPLLDGGVVRNFMGETLEDQLYRRLNACEESIRNLWEAHNSGNAGDR